MAQQNDSPEAPHKRVLGGSHERRISLSRQRVLVRFFRTLRYLGWVILTGLLGSLLFSLIEAPTLANPRTIFDAIASDRTSILLGGVTGLFLLLLGTASEHYLDRSRRLLSVRPDAIAHDVAPAISQLPEVGAREPAFDESPDQSEASDAPTTGRDAPARILKEGLDALRQGNISEARRILSEAREQAASAHDDATAAAGLSALGTLAERIGNLTEARHYHDEARTIFAYLNMHTELAHELQSLGELAEEQGQLGEAQAAYRQSLAYLALDTDPSGHVSALFHMANLSARQGAVEEAERYLRECLAIQSMDDLQGRVSVLRRLGEFAQARGRLDEARTYYDDALRIATALNDPSDAASLMEDLGDLSAQQGDIGMAERYLEMSLSAVRAEGNRHREAIVLGKLGAIALERGDSSQAEALYTQVLVISRQLGDRRAEAGVLANLGSIASYQGGIEVAQGFYGQALGIGREVGDLPFEAATLRALGELAQRQGRLDEAAHFFADALTLHQQVGDDQGEEQYLAKPHGDVTAREEAEPRLAADAREGSNERSRVHFSAYYSRIVPVETPRTLVVYIHMPQAQPRIRADVVKFQDEMGSVKPREVTTAAIQPVARGTYLTIVPDCDGFEFNPPSMRLRWGGSQERAVFSFQADRRMEGSAVNGEIDIYVEALNVATLKLAFLCDETAADTSEDQQKSTAPLYERIFASYSHADTAVVEACRRAYTALGMQVLIDTETLRSGELFTPALERMIDGANVFQLFWSGRAAQSDFVRHEWMYALGLNKGASFIRPVRWERPLVPEPPELSQVHFKFIPLPSVEDDASTREDMQLLSWSAVSAPSPEEALKAGNAPSLEAALPTAAVPSRMDTTDHTNEIGGKSSLVTSLGKVDPLLPPSKSLRRRWWQRMWPWSRT